MNKQQFEGYSGGGKPAWNRLLPARFTASNQQTGRMRNYFAINWLRGPPTTGPSQYQNPAYTRSFKEKVSLRGLRRGCILVM